VVQASQKHSLFKQRGKSRYDLAEIIGIFLGDGGIYLDKHGKYHLTVSFHKEETSYRDYARQLLERYFAPYRFRVDKLPREFFVRNISVNPGRHLAEQGLCAGNKRKNKVVIPSWIFLNRLFLRRCIRGLFDTDGCIYRKYSHYAQIQFKF